MTYTVIGVLADELGHARNPASQLRSWSSPAADYRTVQPARIPIDRSHDHRWIGEIVYLERHAGNLWAVGEVDAEPTVAVKVGEETVHVETPMYWSAERASTLDDRDIMLRSVALTHAPARVAARPLVWFDGGLDHRSGWTLDWHLERGLINRAGEARHTRHGGPLVVHDRDQSPAVASAVDVPPAGEGPGQLMLRTAEVVDVTPARRVINLIAVPHERATLVLDRKRVIEEVITRGAFAGVERDPGKVYCNRDHDDHRLIGKAVSFDPHAREGLLTEIKVAKTDLGDESLQLAAEGILGCSVGFAARRGGEAWENGGKRRRVNRALLAHLALTPTPAYEDAKVLAVRALR